MTLFLLFKITLAIICRPGCEIFVCFFSFRFLKTREKCIILPFWGNERRKKYISHPGKLKILLFGNKSQSDTLILCGGPNWPRNNEITWSIVIFIVLGIYNFVFFSTNSFGCFCFSSVETRWLYWFYTSVLYRQRCSVTISPEFTQSHLFCFLARNFMWFYYFNLFLWFWLWSEFYLYHC